MPTEADADLMTAAHLPLRARIEGKLAAQRERLDRRRLPRDAAAELRRDDRILREPERFVVFVGYPRSSHSLVGAILDAHPDMVVSHELNALWYVQQGIDRSTLLGLVLARERWFGRRNYEWTGYSYRVPGQWQGRARAMRVVGDKRGGATTELLVDDPTLLDRLQDTIGLPVHVIHVIRNPYDNVARMALHSRLDDRAMALEQATTTYLESARTAAQARDNWPAERWFDLGNEELCRQPRDALVGLSRFLGVDPVDDWLVASSALIFDKPSAARTKVDWPPEVVRRLAAGLEGLPGVGDYPQDLQQGT